jgi:putative phosphoesterase
VKIALISDIHSNLHALKDVLRHAKRHGAESVWDLGDMLGFGAFPDEVVNMLRKKKVLGVAGNFDERIMKFPKKAAQWRHEKDPDKFLMLKYSYESLSPANRKYLKNLPLRRKITVEGRKILLVHASPESDREHLGPETPVERLNEISLKTGFDIIICGHSHRPFVRKAGKAVFINPGTVGMPDDGDTRASFAILEINSKKDVRVHHYRVDYDVQAAAAAVIKKDLPDVFSRMILEAKNYTAVRKEEESRENEMENQAERLAASHCYEEAHSKKVADLALMIFDGLEELHGLSSQDRTILKCASILHDIGISEGGNAHHKLSMDMILKGSLPGFTENEKLITALIARYHRKALPDSGHEFFSSMNENDRRKVSMLSAILRVADGLDRTHSNAVTKLSCEISGDKITFILRTFRPSETEMKYGLIKSDLMKKVFDREIEIR